MTVDRTALRAVASLADARQRRLEAELEHATCACPDPVEEWVPSLGRYYCRFCLCGVAVMDEDVYDVARKADDDEVGECPHCGLPFTRCDCDIEVDRCWDCLLPFEQCRCDRGVSA